MLRDVSRPLTARMRIFPGDPAFISRPVASLDRGDPAAVGQLSLGTHSGTHLDAPGHVLRGGGGIETLDLEALIGPCQVIRVEAGVARIGLNQVGRVARPRVLFQTAAGSSLEVFDPTFAGLDEPAAMSLVAQGVRLVGIDAPSIDPMEESERLSAHRILLGAGVAVVEELDLSGIEPGAYQLYCLPLLIPGADGAPARVLLGD